MLRALPTTGICMAALLLVPGVARAEDPPVALMPGAGGTEGGVLLTPVDPGSAGSGSGGKAGTSGTRRASASSKCTIGGQVIDCTSPAGVWSQERQCWVRRLSPQPPPDSPSWQGKTDGAIYWCTAPDASGTADYEFWAPDSGALGAPVLVDPVTLAEQAIESMNLEAIQIGITPPEGSDTYTLLGIPTWMWVAEPSPRTWGPISRSASAGSVTVTARARVTGVVWDMGDGARVTCGRGTAYGVAQGADASPDCGHRYERAGRYQITATTSWEVDWAGAGQTGSITFTLARDASVWVREAHGLISEQG